MRSRDESEYPKSREGDADYFTSQTLFDDLAVVIRRFPTRHGVPPGGRPLVLVHGIGVSSRYFHATAAELAKYATVYLVDLPGYGSAPNPRRDVAIADHADVLAKFLRVADIERPILVGHSMGTQVITKLALDHPEVTDKLVLLAPTMDSDARTLLRATGRLMYDSVVCEPLAVRAIVLVDYFFRCGIPYFLKQTKHLLADRIEDRLPQLEVTALVIRGDRDCIAPPDWTREVTRLLKRGTFAEVKGPHVVMFTDPKRIAALISEHAES